MDTSIDLAALADQLIAIAGSAAEGRATERVDLGHGTLGLMAMGFAAGGELPAHDNPGEAALQVLRGRVRLSWQGSAVEVEPGRLVRIPDARHRVEALEPSAILLTAVSLPGGPAH